MLFSIGDKVKHNIYGVGEVEKSDSRVSAVYFEDNEEVKSILNEYLILVEQTKLVPTNEETLDIYPKNFDEISAVSADAKELANYLANQKEYGSLYLDVGLREEKGKKYSFLVSSKGITVVDYVNVEQDVFDSMKKLIISGIKKSQEILKNKIVNILELSNDLIVDKELIVNIQVYTFVNESMAWLEKYLKENSVDCLSCKDIFFVDLPSKILSKHKSIIVEYLAPQYVVVIPRNSNHLNKHLKNTVKNITGHSNGVELSMLKEDQIKTLYEINEGIELILANAGSGKSVILLAKAYELCSLGYQNVLVTCYNSNLSEEYRYKSEECGLNDKKDLYIMTFHKFILKYCKDVFNKEFDYEEIEDAVYYLIDELQRNKSCMRFDAIFIDEMQIFNSEWLDLCYLLLRDPKENSYLVMAGDINQDVKGNSSDASLNFYKAEMIPESKKNIKVKYLNYNYRNTKEISDMLNKMLINHNKLLNRLHIDRVSNIENYVLGESINNGPKPYYIKTNRLNITSKIIEEIERMKSTYKLQYGDIAVIFPYQERKFMKYYLSLWLSKELQEKDIPFNFIFGNTQKSKMSEIDGVVLSTIDSSLGLDFKAVIICGLYTLSTYNYEDKEGNLKTKKVGSSIIQTDRYAFDNYILVEGYKLYIGCSRARKYLTVINDLEKDHILVDSIFGGVF